MQIRKIWLSSLLLCVALTGSSLGQKNKPAKPAPKPAEQAAPVAAPEAAPVAPPTPASPALTIDFTPNTVNPGSTFGVMGTSGATLSVYSPKADVACSDTGLSDLGDALPIVGEKGSGPTTPLTGTSQTIQLKTPVKVDDQLCLVATKGTEAVYSALITVSAEAGKIDFAIKPVGGTSSISVQGDDKAVVSVWQFPADYGPNPKSSSCTVADRASAQVLAINATDPTTNSTTINGSKPFTITLNKQLQAKSILCLHVTETVAGKVSSFFSPFTVVQDAPAATTTTNPSFNDKDLESGSKSISVKGVKGADIAVFEFELTDKTKSTTDKSQSPADKTQSSTDKTQSTFDCRKEITAGNGKQLAIATSVSSTSSYSATLDKTIPGPYSVNLVNGLNAHTQICLQQTVNSAIAGGSPAMQYSTSAIYVKDSNNPYPHVRTFYTAGVMINNRYSSNGTSSSSSNSNSSSSTGAAYLDFGMAFLPWIESNNRRGWGFNTSISGRFSALPVAAPSTATGGSSSSNNGTLNILSSQESARVLGSASFPTPLWEKKKFTGNYAFFTAPVVKAGFDTLLNPSATSTSSSGTTAANFAPVYWEYSSGLRTGYRQYPANTEKDSTPHTIAQVDITIGKYSNLQSYVCNPNVTSGTSTSQPTNTVCFIAPPSGSSTYTLDQSRTNLYRMEVSGFFSFPYGFVVGLDANLPQSSLAPRNMDILNKAPGNVAIYFGISGSLTSLFNNLKLSGANQ
jgi:hypothetical protein